MNHFGIKDLEEIIQSASLSIKCMPRERAEPDLDFPVKPREVYDTICRTIDGLNRDLSHSVFQITPKQTEFDAAMAAELRFGSIEVQIHFTPRGSTTPHLVTSFKIATAKIPDTIPDSGHTVPGHFQLHDITAADSHALETIILQEMEKLVRTLARQAAEGALRPHRFTPAITEKGKHTQ